jgi:hypothetical protein
MATAQLMFLTVALVMAVAVREWSKWRGRRV